MNFSSSYCTAPLAGGAGSGAGFFSEEHPASHREPEDQRVARDPEALYTPYRCPVWISRPICFRYWKSCILWFD